jgi:phosphoribosylanthranilate isomerase
MNVMSRELLFVKVCGITRLQDADCAAGLGATAIGFIFWPGSPRYIAPDDAREIVRQTSSRLSTVGVFVNASMEQIRTIVGTVGLDLAQLHGSESPEYCRQLARLGPPGPEGHTRLIKAVGLKDGAAVDAEAEIDGFDSDVVILLDTHDPARHGGTGRTVNWNAARQIAASRRTILSGGLSAENVGAALESVRPYGIDVSSGVESAPGVKDAGKLRRFFEALND